MKRAEIERVNADSAVTMLVLFVLVLQSNYIFIYCAVLARFSADSENGCYD